MFAAQTAIARFLPSSCILLSPMLWCWGISHCAVPRADLPGAQHSFVLHGPDEGWTPMG